MAAMAAPMGRRKMRVFDGFSVLFVVGVAAILTTAWLVVDRAQVTTDELLDQLAVAEFEEALPDGLVLRSVERSDDKASVVLAFQDELADSQFAKNNSELVVSYTVHRSRDDAAAVVQEVTSTFEGWQPLPPGFKEFCPPSCKPPLRLEPIAAGVPAMCGDYFRIGSEECTFAVGRVTVWLDSRIAVAREAGPTYLDDLSRAALDHLEDAGGAAFR